MSTQTPFEKQKIEEFREKFDYEDLHQRPMVGGSLSERIEQFLQTALREQREMIEKEFKERLYGYILVARIAGFPRDWVNKLFQSLTPQELEVEKKI